MSVLWFLSPILLIFLFFLFGPLAPPVLAAQPTVVVGDGATIFVTGGNHGFGCARVTMGDQATIALQGGRLGRVGPLVMSPTSEVLLQGGRLGRCGPPCIAAMLLAD